MRAILTILAILVAVIATLFFGTNYAMERGSLPAQYRIMLSSDSPTNCVIRVTWWTRTNEFFVSKDGEVLVDVPALPHGCSLVCLGIRLSDISPRNKQIIDVVRDGRIVRRLSLRQLEQLPSDASGTRRLSL
jgi:hypothetical protein